MLLTTIKNKLEELVEMLRQISDTDYKKPSTALSGATIGEHTRHIIEMFSCLESGYELGTVDYDSRKRDLELQNSVIAATEAAKNLQIILNKDDKPLVILQVLEGNEIRIASNYNRELLYNLEHCIHHQALIKVGLLESGNVIIGKNFGVAPSTIQYRDHCAQ